jgi:hypothetical protein
MMAPGAGSMRKKSLRPEIRGKKEVPAAPEGQKEN